MCLSPALGYCSPAFSSSWRVLSPFKHVGDPLRHEVCGDAQDAWRRGVLVVPAGEDGSLMQATPPLTITDAEIDEALERLA